METNKTKYENEFDALMKNKYVKTGTKIFVGIAALYLLSKVFTVVGSVAKSFNQMKDSFQN